MVRINIKPLSVNEAFKGRRFKTAKYEKYTKDVMLLLPVMNIPSGNLSITFEFGFATSASDIDNGIKQIQDILSLKYGFNDNRIYHLDVTKKVVGKGNEYIDFYIEKYHI